MNTLRPSPRGYPASAAVPDAETTSMIMEILSHLLKRGDNPASIGDYITNEMLRLYAADCVVLIQCLCHPSSTKHRVVSASPVNGCPWSDLPAAQRFYNDLHELHEPTTLEMDEQDPERLGFLLERGIQRLVVHPLYVGELRVGALIIVGGADPECLARHLEILRHLSPIVALVLRNSFLFDQQEQLIQERTRRLEESNSRLATELLEKTRNEQLLADKEERFRTLFETAGDAIWLMDGEIFIECNPRAVEIFGFESKDEMIGVGPAQISPPIQPDGRQSRQAARQYIEAALAGQPQKFYWRHWRKDRELLDLEITLTAMHLKGSNYLQAVGRDMAAQLREEARKQAAAMRAEALLKLNQLATAPRDEIIQFALAEALRLTASSGAYLAWFDEAGVVVNLTTWPPPAGKNTQDPAIPTAVPGGLWQAALDQRCAMIINHGGDRAVTSGGSNDEVSRHLDVPVFAAERVIAVAGVVNKAVDYNSDDLDQLNLLMEGVCRLLENKQVEAALRESEAMYRRIVDTATEGIWLTRGDVTTFVNARMAEILGLGVDDMLGRPPEEFLFAEDVADYLQKRSERHQGISQSFERRLRHRDGRAVWMLASVSPIMDDDGRVVGSFGMFSDITERKSAEDALHRHQEMLETNVAERTRDLVESRRAAISLLQDANEQRARAEQALGTLRKNEAALEAAVQQAEAANKELEAFSYSVSHDLRAPLRHIAGFVQLLQGQIEAIGDAKAIRYAGIISGAADKMGQLIDELLAFSRAGRSQMRLRRVGLTDLVALCREELESETNGRDIEWDIGDLPDVHADAILLRQVLINLLSNAVKYTRRKEHARIAIHAREDAGEILVTVSDNGAGFDMRFINKLFGVFQRLHSEEEFEGTGIGLANVQRIIARHGGRVWAEGEVDKGASFTFTLPIVREES